MESLAHNPNTRPPENLAPPVDPVVPDPTIAFGEGQKDLNDAQAAKRGRSTVAATDSDVLNSIEVDDQSYSLSEGGNTDGAIAVTVEGDGIPPKSYARAVAGVGVNRLSASVPSLDDIVVEEEDVTVNTSGVQIDGSIYRLEYEGLQRICFTCGIYGHSTESSGKGLSKDGSHAGEGIDAAASNNQHRPMPMEDTIYGLWMVVGSRRRPTRRDNHSNRVQPTGSRLGGSRFNILNEFDSADVTPGNITESSEPNGVVISVNNSSSVGNSALGVVRLIVDCSSVNVASDVSRKVSSGVVLNVVIVNENAHIPVVYSGGSQVPQVVTHEVHNVAGTHVVVSILDDANEQRLQRLATMGAKQGDVCDWLPPGFGLGGASSSGTSVDVQPPTADPMRSVEAMVNLGSRMGNNSVGVHRN
ncbi:hypothetical protein V6N13_133969 [Hibiscus sabdariffa]